MATRTRKPTKPQHFDLVIDFTVHRPDVILDVSGRAVWTGEGDNYRATWTISPLWGRGAVPAHIPTTGEGVFVAKWRTDIEDPLKRAITRLAEA